MVAPTMAGVGVWLAALVMAAVSGWTLALVLTFGLGWTASTAWIVVAAIGGGVLAYSMVYRRWSERTLALTLLARDLRDAAARPRDHIAVVKAKPAIDLSGAWPEVRELALATYALLDRIEQRHARQTAWIAAVVHDVKTPIAAGANTLAVLANRPGLSGTEDGLLVLRLSSELRVLVADVQRMLDAIRFERDDVIVGRESMDLEALVAGIVERLVGVRSVGIRVTGTGRAWGDRALVERALENVIANAVRYARHVVDVEVFPGLVRVADDGHGLPAPLEHLTQPFRSEPIDVAGVAVAGGAGGIGLFLARRVLEMHGGKLVLESTSAKGTVLLAYVGSGDVSA